MDNSATSPIVRKVRVKRFEREPLNPDARGRGDNWATTTALIVIGIILIIWAAFGFIGYVSLANQMNDAQRQLDEALQGLDQSQLGSISPMPWGFLLLVFVMDSVALIAGVLFLSTGIILNRRRNRKNLLRQV